MHSEISIWIDAPPDLVFPLAADLEQWGRRLPHYSYVRILGRSDAGVHAAMSARRGAIPVFWEAVQTADPGSRTIRFRHVRGITRGMEVLWTLTQEGAGTRARIDHDLDLRWPLIGPWLAERVIAREFIQPIAAKTLQRFKALAEGAEASRRAPRKDAPAPEARES
jgi:ribosome-associated toxin RatA of RatAB toxin-antitoxin module